MKATADITKHLRQVLYDAWLAVGGDKTLRPEEIHLEHPAEAAHGDYSSNVALAMFSRIKNQEVRSKGKKKETESRYSNPLKLAEAIVSQLNNNETMKQYSHEIQAVKPGFINLWLKNEYLISEAERVITSSSEYGKSKALKGKRIMLEFGQPNTHKIPHIGHLFSYVLGESLARILKANGATLFRANYQGDIGLHVAKCLWAIKQSPKEIKKLKTLGEKVTFLQKAYQEGSRAYEEDEPAKEEILQINKSLYMRDNQELTQLWQETRGWSVKFYKQFEEELNVHYDRYYFESEMYGKGMKIVKQGLGKIFAKSQGAIIFEGSKYGLHDRVFITKWGTPTYEAKDMALQTVKYDEWPFDLSIITTASEQNEYFKVVFKALEELAPQFKGKLKHIGFGMVSLKGMKMSSRKGKIVSAPELVEYTIQEADNLALERGVNEDNHEIKAKQNHVASLSERNAISKQVGLGAIKYSFLKSRVEQDIVFNFGESISLEGDSGPYLQYTFARTQSVLEKAEQQGVEIESKKGKKGEILGLANESPKVGVSEEGRTLVRVRPLSYNQEELAILRWLYRFPEVVKQAGEEYAPNVVADFLYELAQRYNTFYNKHRILEARSNLPAQAEKQEVRKKNTKETNQFRLLLTAATGQVIKNGLTLLGIEPPEKM